MTTAMAPGGQARGASARSGPTFADRVAQERAARLADTDAAAAQIGLTAPPDDRPSSVAEVAALTLAATATFCITSLLSLLLIAVAPTAILGWAATVIESSSMQPTVERGDIVVLRPIETERAGVGAVVRFPADDGGSSIVHRIVEVDTESGAYITKGDANRNDDQALVPFANVDGLGTILVPLIGHPALWYHEGRHLLLALVGSAGAGVIWVGMSVGAKRSDESNERGRGRGRAAIFGGQPLTALAVGTPMTEPRFTHAAQGRPGRGQPGSP